MHIVVECPSRPIISDDALRQNFAENPGLVLLIPLRLHTQLVKAEIFLAHEHTKIQFLEKVK